MWLLHILLRIISSVMVVISNVNDLVKICIFMRIIIWNLVNVVVHVFADIVKLKIVHAFHRDVVVFSLSLFNTVNYVKIVS